MNTFSILCKFNIIAIISCQLQCVDEKGNAVDWYVVYKLPKVSDAEPPLNTGLRYAYMTSMSDKGWTLSDLDISDETSIFGQTLHPLYAKKVDPSISYINYNDHWPNDTIKSTGAHAKGVIAADDSHGFWLIHSVPMFAAEESGHKYVYPESGETYGQTALCITYKLTEIDNILEQLLYMHPNVYTMRVSTHLKSKSSKIAALSDKDWISGDMNVQTITSAGGVNFTSFSKAPGDQVDLYSQIMASVLNTSLYVETWRQGSGHPLPSECSLKKTVENIDDISVSFVNSKLKGGFGYHKDHSKWAISKSPTVPYVCVGDLNRVESQKKRGGGQTCFQSPNVWKHMNDWVMDVEKCDKVLPTF